MINVFLNGIIKIIKLNIEKLFFIKSGGGIGLMKFGNWKKVGFFFFGVNFSRYFFKISGR